MGWTYKCIGKEPLLGIAKWRYKEASFGRQIDRSPCAYLWARRQGFAEVMGETAYVQTVGTYSKLPLTWETYWGCILKRKT